MSALRIISNILNHSTVFKIFEVIFRCQELQSLFECLLATYPGLPHGQRNGRPTIDLQKQVLITIWTLGNSECLGVFVFIKIENRICGVIANNLSIYDVPTLLKLSTLGKMIHF